MPRTCMRLCGVLALACADLAAQAAGGPSPAVRAGETLPLRPGTGVVFLEPADEETTRVPKRTADSPDNAVATTAAPEAEETTVPEETTTPPPPKTPPAILKSLADALFYELYHTPYQWVNACLALAFGSALVWNGAFVFKWAVIGSFALVAMIMAMNQISTAWELDFRDNLRHVAGFEVFFITGFAAWKGFEGLQVATGAALGAFLAQKSLDFLVHYGLVVRHWFAVVVYSLFALSFTAMFSEKAHFTLLAFIAPAVGGLFATSALAFAVTEMAVNGYLNWLPLHGLQPLNGKWIEFFHFIWEPEARDVGLFAGSPYTTEALGPNMNLDRLLDWIFWFLLFVAGSFVQYRRDLARRRKAASSLGEPLLAS